MATTITIDELRKIAQRVYNYTDVPELAAAVTYPTRSGPPSVASHRFAHRPTSA